MTALAIGLSVACVLLGLALARAFPEEDWLNAAAGWLTIIGFSLSIWNMYVRSKVGAARRDLGAVVRFRPDFDPAKAEHDLSRRLEDGVLLGLIISTAGSLLSNYAKWISALIT